MYFLFNHSYLILPSIFKFLVVKNDTKKDTIDEIIDNTIFSMSKIYDLIVTAGVSYPA